MSKFSPKVEIINHFDRLINRVDIDIEKSLEKYKTKVLSQFHCFDIRKRNIKANLNNLSLNYYSFECFDSNVDKINIEYQTVDEFSESTKVVDYLNQIRKRTIDELTKAQEDTLEHLKLNSSQFKSIDIQLIDEKKMDEIRSEIFKEKFYFQVIHKIEEPQFVDPWIFNLYTFVTDFYMSSFDIYSLEKFINSSEENVTDLNLDSKFVFDEKTVLIGLLVKHFFANLKTQKFPSHVIIVRKEDILNIRNMFFYQFFIRAKRVNLSATSIDLSKLESFYIHGIDPEEIKIEGLSSLKSLTLSFKSLDQVILKNLFELRELNLSIDTTINSEFLI